MKDIGGFANEIVAKKAPIFGALSDYCSVAAAFREARLMKKCAAILLLFVFFCAGCSSKEPEQQVTYALGTECIQTVYEGDPSALEQGQDLLYEIDSVLNFYREGSEINEINQNSGQTLKVSQKTARVIGESLEISRLSGGAFDITMGAVSELWGFSGDPSVPAEKNLQEALATVGYEKLSLNGEDFSAQQCQKIDLGGIGKGYAADELAKLYREKGVTSAIINLGGNVYVLGRRPDGQKFRVGIVDPLDTSRYFAWIELEDVSIVTSGTYEKNFEENGTLYHHILDPKTGYPVENSLASVSILSKNSMLADGLSTAAFVLGEEAGMEMINEIDGVEAVFVTKDKRILYSEGFSDQYELHIEEETGYVS